VRLGGCDSERRKIMATDDRRMHEGRSRSLDDRAPREARDEESIIGADERRREGDEATSTMAGEQESALGGHVATHSGTAETPEDERTG
jgi:hypothetical protein